MLAEATVELARSAVQSTVVARRAGGFVAANGLAPAAAVNADWTRPVEFVGRVRGAILERGPVDLSVAWVHTDGRDALTELLVLLDEAPCRLVLVLGSLAGDPREAAERLRRRLARYPRIEPSFVALGSKAQGGGRRWLTHREISAGVVECVALGRDTVVGEIVPS